MRLIRTVTAGSSPLTRGKHGARQRTRRLSGLIPAHAGKTFAPTPKSIHGEAHPRSRGENTAPPAIQAFIGGSSPLTRGKPAPHRATREIHGLIPAHAGKTSIMCWLHPPPRAHPRSRGENARSAAEAWMHAGSSPLTRGKRAPAPPSSSSTGLIPAHAGKTRRAALRGILARAHPRSRGENSEHNQQPHTERGSSPLTRGKLITKTLLRARFRLIPAHAGKTPLANDTHIRKWAHPRSRGENARVRRFTVCQSGSSPLTRGKPSNTLKTLSRPRLIPAHAGKTPTCDAVHTLSGAHPRSRGENCCASHCLRVGEGSSPLTRGKLRILVGRARIERLIPAHAGKTTTLHLT